MRRLSLAHLSAFRLSPPELVRAAAGAGFDLVGALRLTPTSDGRGHPMLGGAAMRRATVQALDDTGLTVLDVEVHRLRAETSVDDALPLLEAGAELGARYLLCTVEDADSARRAGAFAALCEAAGTYGLTCAVEPMVFSQVRTPGEARALLAAAGDPAAAVLVDALHLFRAGGSVADVAALEPRLLPYVPALRRGDARPGDESRRCCA